MNVNLMDTIDLDVWVQALKDVDSVKVHAATKSNRAAGGSILPVNCESYMDVASLKEERSVGFARRRLRVLLGRAESPGS
jgi:hypothetical protein